MKLKTSAGAVYGSPCVTCDKPGHFSVDTKDLFKCFTHRLGLVRSILHQIVLTMVERINRK